MRKTFFACIALLLMLLIPGCVYAGTPGSSDEVEFSVTGGVSFDSDKVQSTFDKSRTISGSALNGTLIEISVSTKDAAGELFLMNEYSTEVGATGLFSQSVELELGENVIVIKASLEGLESAEKETSIKRKRQEIKTELENNIVLPGFSGGLN